jgi:hypothetical protein
MPKNEAEKFWELKLGRIVRIEMTSEEIAAAERAGIAFGEPEALDAGDGTVLRDKPEGTTEPRNEQFLSVGQDSPSEPDFIDTYRRYADVYELPAEVHEAIALALLAAAANGNVWIELGDKVLSLDCWILITTGSGGGRNTAIRKCRPILEASKLNGLVRNISWGSEPIVKQHFAENPQGLYVWTEMSEKLQDLNRPQFAGVKPWITDLYDETTPPPNKIYRRIPGRKNTPTIEFKVAPRTTFIATSSFEWLLQNLSRVDSTGGFLARWMHIHITGKSKRIPIPLPSDKKLIPVLAARLRQVAELEGTADCSCVRDLYVDWYDETARRFEQQPNQDIAQAYWNRHRDHLLKLAVLFEMSRSGTLKVSPGSMKRAIAYAEQIESSLFKIFPTGFEREGYELERMMQLVKKAGAEGINWSEFTRAFKNMDSGQRIRRLGTLLEGHDLHRFSRSTKGRNAWVLVHKECHDDYKNNHPEDTETPWESSTARVPASFLPGGPPST